MIDEDEIVGEWNSIRIPSIWKGDKSPDPRHRTFRGKDELF